MRGKKILRTAPPRTKNVSPATNKLKLKMKLTKIIIVTKSLFKLIESNGKTSKLQVLIDQRESNRYDFPA